jgi:hypothetical protein
MNSRWSNASLLRIVACLGAALAFTVRSTGTATSVASAEARVFRAYAFRVNTHGLLLDENGVPIPVADVRARLSQLDRTGVSAIALWVEGDAVQNLVPTIHAFEGLFTNIIVKVWEPTDRTGLIELPLTAEMIAARAKEARGAPTAGDFAARRPELRPEAPPPGVRYTPAANDVVGKAADALTARFLSDPPRPDAVTWSRSVWVMSGAWKLFQSSPGLGRNRFQPQTRRIVFPAGTVELKEVTLRDAREIRALDAELQNLIAADGGGQVRVLNRAEMEVWPQCHPFEMAEPLFVLETAGKRHRFVFGLMPEGIGMIDELNGLPLVTVQPASAASHPRVRKPATPRPDAEKVLQAGQSAILVGGQTIRFPGGTTLCMPGNRTLVIKGQKNHVEAGAGTIVAVSLDAEGEPDNEVTAAETAP